MTRRRTTPQRGYGYRHQQIRKALLPHAVGSPCSRCGKLIGPRDRIDLDHTDDRRGYNGFAHAFCNRSAGSRKWHGLDQQPADPQPKGATQW